MRPPRVLTDETQLLYTLSEKLSQAATPADWLEAVSDYSRDNGATSGRLLVIHLQENQFDVPDYAEIVAVWTQPGAKAGAVGTRYLLSQHQEFAQVFLINPPHPLLIPDIMDSPHIQGQTRDLFVDMDLRGMVVLPLNVKGRRVAELVFCWNVPVVFTEADRRIYTAIIQQAGPVIDSMRLYEHSQERAARVEMLLAINTALSRATDEAGILAALALYAHRDPPQTMALMYRDPRCETEFVMTTMAIWQNGQIVDRHPRLGRTFSLSDGNLTQYWLSHPGQVILIGDIDDDPRLDQSARALIRKIGIRTLALLPLYSYGQWQGIISIEWESPHNFLPIESSIYQSLMQTLPSVVASRRAYLDAEEVRQEREQLYNASKGINAARSFQEIVEALIRLNLDDLSVVLWVWEHYDLSRAGYMELVAKSEKSAWPLGTRLPTHSVPLVQTIECRQLIVVEDTARLAQVDPVTAATTESQGYHALLSVPGRSFHGAVGLRDGETARLQRARKAAGRGHRRTGDRRRRADAIDGRNRAAQWAGTGDGRARRAHSPGAGTA